MDRATSCRQKDAFTHLMLLHATLTLLLLDPSSFPPDRLAELVCREGKRTYEKQNSSHAYKTTDGIGNYSCV